MNWRDRARCAGADTDLFFNSRPDYAKRSCGKCPVVKKCRDFATEHRIPYGVFGGEDGSARRKRLGISDAEVIGDAA